MLLLPMNFLVFDLLLKVTIFHSNLGEFGKYNYLTFSSTFVKSALKFSQTQLGWHEPRQ